MIFASMQRLSFTFLFWQNLTALMMIAAVTAVFSLVRDVLDTTLIALLYLIPLGVITAFWGLGPGITSALITFLTFNYFPDIQLFFYPAIFYIYSSSTNRYCGFVCFSYRGGRH
jgi:K+-sensing histidine kinase KdpD